MKMIRQDLLPLLALFLVVTVSAIGFSATFNGCGSSTTNVVTAPDSQASLLGLSISAGTLSPLFSGVTTTYTVDVANGVTSLTVTPTAASANALLTVNSAAVASGASSAALPLAVGDTAVTILVTAQNGAIKTYSLTVTRHAALSTNAALAGLTVSQGALAPVFSGSTLTYTDGVSYAVDAMTVTPTVAGANATVTVNGSPLASGAASGLFGLPVGDTSIAISVTAEDLVSVLTYTVTVTRSASSCGDGYIDGTAGEECDNGAGNSNSGSCLTTCKLAKCGDGHVDFTTEQCDTGGVDTIGCNGATCTLSVCGDGRVNLAAGEQCDFSASNGAIDGCCSASCQINTSFTHCP